MENGLGKEETLEYAVILNMINNLYKEKELDEKEYSYAKIILKSDFRLNF